MGDVSVIARRISPNQVQYGWGGNGGYYSNVGARLQDWYDDPELIDYLFQFGQMRLIGKPGSEKGGESWYETHYPAGEAHWVDNSERFIFSRIAFVDYGYFYDSDNTWYYIIPGPFRIKIPLEYIYNHLDEKYHEFDELSRIVKKVIGYFIREFVPADDELMGILANCKGTHDEIVERIMGSQFPVHELYHHYRTLYNAMDDWVVVKTNDEDEKITRIIMKKNQGENRMETIDWE